MGLFCSFGALDLLLRPLRLRPCADGIHVRRSVEFIAHHDLSANPSGLVGADPRLKLDLGILRSDLIEQQSW